MRKRFKVVLNVDITNPDTIHPAGGDYTRRTFLEGVLHTILWANRFFEPHEVKITLDKVIDKGEIDTPPLE